MLDKFTFYDLVGIVVPGAITLFGLSLLFPNVGVLLATKDFALGELGLFLVLSYGAGHVVAALSDLLENWLWKRWGGWPTDRVRTNKDCPVSASQRADIQAQLQTKLSLSAPIALDSISEHDWEGITRQIYVAVQRGGKVDRVDTFNGIYGLCRGLAAGLAILALVAIGYDCYWLHKHTPDGKSLAESTGLLALLAGVALALYRTYRFGRHYARELFVQFLQIPLPTEPAQPPSDPQTVGPIVSNQ